VEVVATAVRRNTHPRGANLAHVVGYLGRATEAEVTASKGAITDQDLVGRAGLEAQYDSVLRGTPGRVTVAVDPRGVVVREVSRVDPVPGADLRTNIDLGVQVAAEKGLAAQVAAARKHGQKADSAAAVVLDVRTGGVVASASYPTYDPQVWTGGISERDYAQLTAVSAGTPLLDRVSSATFPPASTFKVVSVPAAVQAGNGLGGTYDCTSAYRVGNRDFHNFESRAYGPISMVRVMEISCDTVFYAFAYRSWLAQGGLAARTDAADPFVAWARAYGLGSRTGIDLPGEASGRIPDRAWKQQVWQQTKGDLCRRATSGYPEVAKSDPGRAAYLQSLARENCSNGWQYRGGDAANFAIGQGDVAVTPLQMAVVFGAIANGGTRVVPRVAAATVVDGRATALPAPAAGARVAFQPQVLAFLHTALRAVVLRGTAAAAFAGMPADWPVSGKTGTGEVFGKGDTGWFVSYAPSTAPRYAVAVTISQGGTGATFAAPVARSIHLALRAAR
jgi:penicillin-binding protein 2